MTTARSTWKSRERQAAALFGTTRTPLSGGASGHTRSDSLHEHVFIETKLRARSSIHRLFDQTALQAKAEKKVPVLALAMKNRPGLLLVLRADDIQEIAGAVAAAKGEPPCL
jgi:hypothetical protein